ncbi:hypothetical protein ADK58_30830 [Streptomyces sp. XY152]|nr:hypothetical protein ADK58_30830 [Streptomyces sp. XY152]
MHADGRLLDAAGLQRGRRRRGAGCGTRPSVRGSPPDRPPPRPRPGRSRRVRCPRGGGRRKRAPAPESSGAHGSSVGEEDDGSLPGTWIRCCACSVLCAALARTT